MDPYKTPLCAAVAEFTEKKSRFIGSIKPVASSEEALAFLQTVRAQHREASHNVYCYRLKSDAGSQQTLCRHSDDGEPSGTAGMPLLETFLRQDIFDFCCVATRYFGGVLLGAGGLTRAYSRCGAIALEASGVAVMREMALCETVMPYAQYELAKRLLLSCGAEVISEDFGAEVTVGCALPAEDVAALRARMTELTAGTINIGVKRYTMQRGFFSA